MTTTDVNGIAILDNGQQVHLFGNSITDGSGGNLKVRDLGGVNTKEIGEFAPGRSIRTLKINASAGSVLNHLIYYDSDGAILLDVDVDVELNSLGGNVLGMSSNYNLVLRGLNIPLRKGGYIFVMTAD